ncbi:MAG: hypothetical protein KAJ51_02215, partial [Thermoplasmata archaeon]|nr:hypothetical protein [Thermoplasmata archaeon]
TSDSEIKNIAIENANILGYFRVGGLVGKNSGEISNSYVTGIVRGEISVGGLTGRNYGSIINSYATGDVRGSDHVGGLVGYNDHGTILNSYATGSVWSSGGSYLIGGLVGTNRGTISNCYAMGSVTGWGFLVGGLVGSAGGSISNCYATGIVSGFRYIGGLIGSGGASNSFWDKETSGTTIGIGYGYSSGVTGKTTAEMKNVATFTDTDTAGLDISWDFVGNPNDDTGTEDIWDISSNVNDGYPYHFKLKATINFDPDTLNLNSKGNWVTVYIELPDDYDPANIDRSTLLLNEKVFAAEKPWEIKDKNDNGIPELKVKFDRASVQAILEVGESKSININGKLVDGTAFSGTDWIRVIK